MSASKSLLAIAVLLGVLLRSSAGHCQATLAEALFAKARASMMSGDYASARTDLEASYRAEPAPGTLLNLAACEEKLGRFRAAHAHLTVARQSLPADDKRIPSIDQRLHELEARIPTEVPEAPVPSVPVPAPVFPVSLASPPSPASSERAAPKHPLLPYAIGAGAAGIAGLTVGIVGAAQVLHYKHVVAGHCDDRGCDRTGLDGASSGKAWSLAATIGTIAGVAFAGSAAWLSFGVRPTSSPSAEMTIRGRF